MVADAPPGLGATLTTTLFLGCGPGEEQVRLLDGDSQGDLERPGCIPRHSARLPLCVLLTSLPRCRAWLSATVVLWQHCARVEGSGAEVARGGENPALDTLIANMIGEQKIRAGDVDDRVRNFLSEIALHDAEEALTEFSTNNLSQVQNRSAYLMGILRRYTREPGAAPGPRPFAGGEFGGEVRARTRQY